MEKRIWWLVSILIIATMLTACGSNADTSSEIKEKQKNKTNQSKETPKKKETKDNYIEIASNEHVAMEKKRVKITLPKILNDPRTSKDDRKLSQEGVDEYNNTVQEIYKNSITILSYDSYYDEESRELVIAAVLINNRRKPITNIEFEADMQIVIDPKAKVIPNTFAITPDLAKPIYPGEGTVVPLSFRVLNYTKDVITFNKKEITGSFYNFKFKELDNKK